MSPTDHAGARILIVDDQESNLRLLEFTLRRAGFTAMTAIAVSRDVVPLHLEHPFDLILLDLQMPDMNGFQVMELMSATPDVKPVHILVLSADATQTEEVRQAGATFLAKPFRLPEVVDRVEELLASGAKT